MALPSGAISMSQVNSFLGRSSTAPLSFDDYYFRFIANQTSGTVNFSNLQGKNGGGGTVVLALGETKSGSYQYSSSMTGNVNGADMATGGGNYYYDLNSYAYIQATSSTDWSYPGTYRAQIGSGSIYSGWYSDGFGNIVNETAYPNATGTQSYGTTLTWIAVQV